MNLFNRILVLLLAVAVMLGSALTLCLTLGRWAHRALLDAWPAAEQFIHLVPMESPERWITMAASAGIALLSLVLVGLELRPERREESLVLSAGAEGEVEVVVDSVRRLANHVAERLPNVREVQSRVLPSGKGFRIRCRVAVDPTASVPEVAREVQARVGAAVEHHLGRPLDSISVQTQVTPITQTRRRVR